MKKILSILGSITIIGSTTATVIACAPPVNSLIGDRLDLGEFLSVDNEFNEKPEISFYLLRYNNMTESIGDLPKDFYDRDVNLVSGFQNAIQANTATVMDWNQIDFETSISEYSKDVSLKNVKVSADAKSDSVYYKGSFETVESDLRVSLKNFFNRKDTPKRAIEWSGDLTEAEKNEKLAKFIFGNAADATWLTSQNLTFTETTENLTVTVGTGLIFENNSEIIIDLKTS